MRKRVRLCVAACCYYSGLVKLARWWTRQRGRQLIILNYHRATGGDLRAHLLYLRRHYRMLHLEEALEELYSQKKVGRGQGRRTPLVLTFDDGYRDNYTCAFALARELQVPITVFVVPGYVESGDHFWWLEAERLTQHAQVDKVTLEGRTYYLKQPRERAQLRKAIDTRLRLAASVAEREEFLAALREALGVPAACVSEEEAQALPLTWSQIGEMEASGWVSFGAHTMHHPVLARLRDAGEVRLEVDECRSVLEQRLGHPVRALAYPFGQPGEVGEQAPIAAQEAGYEWVLTTVHGINTPQSDPHQLQRVYGDVSRHPLVMAAETSGVWKLARWWGKRIRRLPGTSQHGWTTNRVQ